MKKNILLFILLVLNISSVEAANLPAESALQKLKQGNARFVQMKMVHPDQTKERREQLAKSQHPFVAVLTCSDSRVPPEIIFDQGLGDIFEIRNAGNVLDQHVLGSIEYAVNHLGVNLVVVLGHESCGAVGAAMHEHEKVSPAIKSLVKSISPAIHKCKKYNKYNYDDVIKTHAQLVTEAILKDKDLYEYVKLKGVKIVPAYYSLTTGKVEFLK